MSNNPLADLMDATRRQQMQKRLTQGLSRVQQWGQQNIPDPIGNVVNPMFGPLVQQFQHNPMDALRGLAPNPVRDTRAMMAPLHQQLQGHDYLAALGSLMQAGAPTGMIGPERQLGTGGAFFHGTSKPIDFLENSSPGINIYGDGLYTTDSPAIAHSYTRKGGGDNPTVYRVAPQAEPPKMYNLNAPPSKPFLDGMKLAAEYSESARDALEAFRTGEARTGADIINHMRRVSSGYMEDAYHILENMDLIRSELDRAGYGGFEHLGGELTGGKPHNVRIYWNPQEQVKLERVYGGHPK